MSVNKTISEKSLNVMIGIILEYRASLDTVSKKFQVDKTELYNKLTNIYDKIIKDAVLYVVDIETKDETLVSQDTASKNINKFFMKLQLAKTSAAKAKIINDLFNNDEINELKSKNKVMFTDEELYKITKFRYKYVLSMTNIEDIFGINVELLSRHESKIEDENLKKKLEILNKHNELKYYNHSSSVARKR